MRGPLGSGCTRSDSRDLTRAAGTSHNDDDPLGGQPRRRVQFHQGARAGRRMRVSRGRTVGPREASVLTKWDGARCAASERDFTRPGRQRKRVGPPAGRERLKRWPEPAACARRYVRAVSTSSGRGTAATDRRRCRANPSPRSPTVRWTLSASREAKRGGRTAEKMLRRRVSGRSRNGPPLQRLTTENGRKAVQGTGGLHRGGALGVAGRAREA
jgi:hypothetical protein